MLSHETTSWHKTADCSHKDLTVRRRKTIGIDQLLPLSNSPEFRYGHAPEMHKSSRSKEKPAVKLHQLHRSTGASAATAASN